MYSSVDPRRVHALNDAPQRPGPVVYWMSRDQRAADNWALEYAREIALSAKQPLAVVFCLVPKFLGATMRQYGFMLKGLEEVERDLNRQGLQFFLLTGKPELELVRFVKEHKAGAVVTDFDPLRIKHEWREKVAARCGVAVYDVDAHNIVPARYVSEKQEYAAYTIRPKIKRLLPEFLTEFPKPVRHPHRWQGKTLKTGWDEAVRSLRVDGSVPESKLFKPGAREAAKRLSAFARNGLATYDGLRNDPNKDGQSGLSPYLHFGQVSAQRIALTVNRAEAPTASKETFLEELVVRRELSDNYCLYNPHYDSMDGIPGWARDTLDAHRSDHREYVYTRDAFERAATHDALWNAAQKEMAETGKMHGYMRMYWAKKILEWSGTPEEAFEIAVYLNDRYELDGRDPNGYAGIAWSIGGVHDRAWGERPVFGKIRYMSYNGCRSKFDVAAYIRKMEGLK